MDHLPVLYIEDEEDYQILVRRILGKAGLGVRTADTGDEGLRALQDDRPELLILDINLPDTDGYAFCSQLRRDPQWLDLPVLMLTVRRRPDEWLRGFSSGATDYVSKPLNPPELLERVVHCIEGKSTRSAGTPSGEYSLIQAAVAGNRSAFQTLVECHRDRLIDGMRSQVRHPQDAEEIASVAFTRAYESLACFRGDASFFTWLYRIAQNEATATHRRSVPLSLEELTHNDESALPRQFAEPDRLHDALADQVSGEQVKQVLSTLSQPYRHLLELFFLRNLSYQEISRRKKLPLGTVMSRLYKARKLLQDAWAAKTPPLPSRP